MVQTFTSSLGPIPVYINSTCALIAYTGPLLGISQIGRVFLNIKNLYIGLFNFLKDLNLLREPRPRDPREKT